MRTRGGARRGAVPALLDVAVAPHRQGHRPRHREHAHEDESRRVDVEVGHEAPEPTGQVELARQEAEDFDGPDEERRHHRQARDHDVVIDLADRPRERPAVGEVHEAPVQRVEQAHTRREEDGQRQHGVERQPARHRRPRQHQQGDLGGGVEAEAEEHADRVDLPRRVDAPGERPEEPVHEAALVELLLELIVVVEAPAQVHEDADDRHQDHEVERGDQVQKRPRHRRPDDGGDAVQPRRPRCAPACRGSGCRG